MREIFVYGTLKLGGSNHSFLASQRFIGPARTCPGFTLYELEGYPGMVVDPTDRSGVTGELWAVDDRTLATLDQLEGLEEGLYRRGPVPLAAPDQHRSVEAYLYLRSVQGRRHVGATWQF